LTEELFFESNYLRQSMALATWNLSTLRNSMA